MIASLLQRAAERIATRLPPATADAVLGDAAELQLSPLRLLCELGGILGRQQQHAWQAPRAWIALAAITLPTAFASMGLSLTVWTQAARLATPDASAICRLTVLALAGGWWAWSSGRALRIVAPATATLAALAAAGPALYCLARFPHDLASAGSLFVLAPWFLCGALSRAPERPRHASTPIAAALITGAFAVMLPAHLWWLGPSWMLALRPHVTPRARHITGERA